MKYTCLNCRGCKFTLQTVERGYILRVHTEDAVDGYTLDTPCRVQMIRNTPCGGKRIHNHIHTVDGGNLYTLIFTMQVVVRKTPPRPYC
jgi:hypothetical protein